MTPLKRLKLINELVSGDIGFDADCYPQKKKKDKDAKIFAELIMEIYRITHPYFSSCPHDGWEAKTKEMIDKLT